jgi:hypothetical protein
MDIKAGQAWLYRAPAGFEASRILVGAVLTFPEGAKIVCCAASGAPVRQPDSGVVATTIPFFPMSEAAFAASVVAPDGAAELPAAFHPALETWRADPRGLAVFTVPFEGSLDRMIALQMAAIIGPEAAA